MDVALQGIRALRRFRSSGVYVINNRHSPASRRIPIYTNKMYSPETVTARKNDNTPRDGD